MTFRDARIVDGSGRTLAVFSPGRFQAMNQVQLLEARGADLYVETTPGGTDPQLWIKLDGPIEIPQGLPGVAVPRALRRIGGGGPPAS